MDGPGEREKGAANVAVSVDGKEGGDKDPNRTTAKRLRDSII
jgi:hypothetical protein